MLPHELHLYATSALFSWFGKKFGYRIDKINKDIHDYYHEVSVKAEEAMKKEITKTVLSSHKEVSDLFDFA